MDDIIFNVARDSKDRNVLIKVLPICWFYEAVLQTSYCLDCGGYLGCAPSREKNKSVAIIAMCSEIPPVRRVVEISHILECGGGGGRRLCLSMGR